MITFRIELERLVRVGADTQDVLEAVNQHVNRWCGGSDDLLHYFEPYSPCARRGNPPFAYWLIDAYAFTQYGPLPFTAGGKPVRWSWSYWLKNAPHLTVTATDLP